MRQRFNARGCGPASPIDRADTVVVTDIQACFAIGAFYADVASPLVGADQPPSALAGHPVYVQAQRRALLYPGLVLGPSATLFMLAWPGWESQYVSSAFERTAGAPAHAAFYAAFLLLLTAAAWFGNWLGFRWALGGARLRLRVVYLAVVAATIALVLARWPAPIRLGSYEAFVRDPSSMQLIWQDRVFFANFWALTIYCAAPLVVWLASWKRQLALRGH
jgi:hypothetical protein